ncbi:MAG: sigma-70 family RNA polymerase sigma factor [Capsulimonadaceae bacterium]|nr:sigma-70 family RNA polymerase sigma factor [Capsulimonadaceae bacterium]
MEAIHTSSKEIRSGTSVSDAIATVGDALISPLGAMAFFPQPEKHSGLFGGLIAPRPSVGLRDEDDALIRRCRGGDRDAYGVLVARHERRVHAIVARILGGGGDSGHGQAADVEDIVQDVFVQAWRALPRFRGDARFSTWLYRIATNRALKEWRRMRTQSARMHETPIEDHTDIDASSPGLSSGTETPQHALDIRFRDGALRAAINALSDKHRTVILLHYYEDYSCEEIAALQECSVGTVWSRLHYGVKRLRDSLGWLDGSEISPL